MNKTDSKSLNPIYNALKAQIMKSLQLDESHFYYDYENSDHIRKRGDSYDFPIVLLSDDNKWRALGQQSGVDLKNEIEVDVYIDLSFYTDDIDELICFEKFINSTYKEPVYLSEYSEDYTIKLASASLDGEEANHEKIRDYYSVGADILISNFIKEKQIFDSTKVELDTDIQDSVLLHLVLIEDVRKKINKQMKELDTKNPEEEKQKQYNNYEKQLEDLEIQEASVYNFQDLTKVVMPVNEYSFSRCYTLMKEKNISITQACELVKKEGEAREKQKQEYKKLYIKNGDESVNRYTDVIVKDVKQKLTLDYPVSIYGGSDLLNYYYDEKFEELTYPCVLIKDCIQFASETEYTTCSEGGELITHRCTIKALPIDYEIHMFVFSNQENQIIEIEKEIDDIYKADVELYVSDPIYKAENDVIKLGIDNKGGSEERIFNNGNQTIYRDVIKFKEQIMPYYVKDYTTDIIKDNSRLQLNRLKVSICYKQAITKITVLQHGIGQLKELTNSESDTNGKSEEFIELKRCFMNHLPIDKELFDKVLWNVVKYHPNLYEEVVINGKSPDMILNDMEISQRAIIRIEQELCNTLFSSCNIPDPSINVTNASTIKSLITIMESNDLCTLEEAILQLCDKVQKDRYEAIEKGQRGYKEQQYDDYSYDENYEQRSSGQGFLSSTIAAAAGAYIGTHGTRKELKKQTKIMKSMEREAKKQREAEERKESREESEKWHQESKERLARSDAIKRRNDRRRRS